MKLSSHFKKLTVSMMSAGLMTVSFSPFLTYAADNNSSASDSKAITTTPSTSNQSQLMSFNFNEIDVRTLIQLISKNSGANFVISDAVKGNITINLTNVTWSQALNTVLTSKSLIAKTVGNVVYINTQDETTDAITKRLQTDATMESLEPLDTSVIKLKYAQVDTIASLLKGNQGGLLSTRGQLSTDLRTNTIVVIDSKRNIHSIKKAIAQVDVPSKQVVIEARIVSLDTNFEDQLGARFGITHERRLSGTLSGANQIVGGTALSAVSPLSDRLNFSNPAAVLSNGSVPGSVGLALARLGPVLLDMELSALESEGHIQIVSRPRVVTSNQEKAVIETGEEIPYQESTSSGATSTSFKKAVLSLQVTPLITPDNKIILKLKATQDTRGQQLVVTPTVTVSSSSSSSSTSTTLPTSFGPPTINTQSVESSITLRNNETFVVGGVYKRDKENTVDRVPFFSSIPVLGNLFKHRSSKDNRSELLIFITPKIVDQSSLDFKSELA